MNLSEPCSTIVKNLGLDAAQGEVD
jgi:hypothetical protein